MTDRTSLRALSSAVLFALLVTAIHPQPAFADEGTPPPDPVGETTSPTGDAALAEGPATAADEATPAPDVVSDAAASEEASAVPPSEPAGQAADVSGAVPSADPSALDESAQSSAVDLLADVPDGTTVAVLDAEGEPVPLVSGEAEAIVASGDPIWCPASVKAPTPNLNGCTDSFGSFALLLADLTDGTDDPMADGIIWIEAGYTGAGEGGLVDIDGSTLATLAPFKLTLRGGWSGTSGDATITQATHDSGTTFEATRLQIQNWANDVTLSDLVVRNSSGGDALLIQTTGAVTLTRVFSHHNTGTGADIDNSDGAAKPVTVSASQFDHNGDQGGLMAHSAGTVTLASVVASDNDLYGAYLDNTSATTAQGVSLTGVNVFNTNGATGLTISTEGAITLSNITASGNSNEDGASLFNYTASTAQPVTLSGTNTFSGNDLSGLYVRSAGAITLNSVTAESNGNYGVQLQNTDAAADQPITLTGTSGFIANDDAGLQINSRGAITLNNITASGSVTFHGAVLVNTASTSRAGVTLTGVNTFEDNWQSGLLAQSHGLIQASDLTALGNGVSDVAGTGYGAYLKNDYADCTGGITLTGTNIFAENYSAGLYAVSLGTIALNSIHASANVADDGVYAYNAGALTAQPVTLTGRSTMNYNDGNGLFVRSNGKITLSNLTANGNALDGADLQNSYVGFASDVVLSGANAFHDNLSQGLNVLSRGAITAANLSADRNDAYGAYLDNAGATSAKGVTLTGTNTFRDNASANLYVDSNGAITIANLTASGSLNDFGAYLENDDADSAQKVSLSGTNTFEDNDNNGLYISSVGAITVSNLRASNNGLSGVNGHGAYLSNQGAPIPQPVTLTGSAIASGNYIHGLWVVSDGNITAANLTASDNQAGYGAYLNNSVAGAGSVTLTGTNVFNGNASRGLAVDSRGAVKLNSLTAHGNLSWHGVVIDNTYGGSPKDVILSGTHVFADNARIGLTVLSRGAITLSSATASGNGTSASSQGIVLDNHAWPTPKPVTLSGTYSVTGNSAVGLEIWSNGAIKVNNLTSAGNGNMGAYLTNANPGAVGGITLSGASIFRDNASTGLGASSGGTITAANLTATGNLAGYGASLDNSYGDADGNVTLTGSNVFTGNPNGLAVSSDGTISISNLTANSNTGYGAQIYNNSALSAKGVTLSGTNAVSNNTGAEGLSISSRGPITINSLTASGNSGSGASLDNYNYAVSGSPQPVKLTGINTFQDNHNYGLMVFSPGAITISSLTASGTVGGYGAWLQNNYPGSIGGITLSGTNRFEDNDAEGLRVYTNGAITLNSLTASGNDSTAATLNNDGAPTPQAVKLTGTNTFNDNLYGLSVNSLGAITVNNLLAEGNTLTAAFLSNDISSSTAGVTLSGTSSLHDNSGPGLWVESYGAITINNLTASGNDGTGAWLDNSSAATPQAIKLTGTNAFYDNQDTGLRAYSSGAITVNNLSASRNIGNGAYLQNDGGTAGVTLTGSNLFNDNDDNGLSIQTHGAVSLTKITAENNTDDGLSITGPATDVTITCGSITTNGTTGIYVAASGVLKLIGVIISGNGTDLDPSASSWTVTRACPLS